jgi:anhydro-N-acetylmuramic acid kinase
VHSKTYHILGVMSGSSLDAIDYAMVQFTVADGAIQHWELKAVQAHTYPDVWRTRLARLPFSPLHHVILADVELGKMIGEHCTVIIRSTGVRPDAIASHGHTVQHNPGMGYTLQIGHPAWIAEATRCPVITDFRSMDIAAGGQGAPLAPVVEKYCFPEYEFYLNLGGIANLSWFAPTGKFHAWDIAPANQLLNFLAAKAGQKYDRDGALARSGVVDPLLLSLLMEPIVLPLRRPFSLDNSWVQEQYFDLIDRVPGSVGDKLATATEYIAQSVAAQINGHTTRAGHMRLLVSGGGAHNKYLIERIRSYIAPAQLILPATEIIDFKEAILMAVCGLLRLLGLPNAFTSVTGANRDTVNGVISS